MANDPRPTTRETAAESRVDQRGVIADARRPVDRDEDIDGEDMKTGGMLGMDEILPKPPKIKGFHTIWLSTTNAYDSIHRRQRAGYVLVKPEEVPTKADYSTVKGGKWDGFVSCEEFLLAKIPEATYRRMLEVLHHEKPLHEEQGLRRAMDALNADEGNRIRIAEIFGGSEGLGRDKRRACFENFA